jgi:hypothetical protein
MRDRLSRERLSTRYFWYNNNVRCFQRSRHRYFTADSDGEVSTSTEGALSTMWPLADVSVESANWHARSSE